MFVSGVSTNGMLSLYHCGSCRPYVARIRSTSRTAAHAVPMPASMPLCPPVLDAPPAPEVPPVLVAPPVPLIPAVPASGVPAVPPPPMLPPASEPPVPPPIPPSDLESPFGREEHAARASPRKMPALATLFMDSFNACVGARAHGRSALPTRWRCLYCH